MTRAELGFTEATVANDFDGSVRAAIEGTLLGGFLGHLGWLGLFSDDLLFGVHCMRFCVDFWRRWWSFKWKKDTRYYLIIDTYYEMNGSIFISW